MSQTDSIIQPQHGESFSPSEQPQVGAMPRRFPFKTAAAHPTPALTLIAPAGQFRAHAPHSIHPSLF